MLKPEELQGVSKRKHWDFQFTEEEYNYFFKNARLTKLEKQVLTLRRECHSSITVGDFADENKTGTYLVTMPNHITVIIDGTIYDTFDCSDRLMRCAWKIKNS